MNLLGQLFRTTIGRKFVMAVTGVVLIVFVAGHLVGNLQVFEDPDRINGYAHFLQSLGPVLWAVRFVLLACVTLHIWAATVAGAGGQEGARPGCLRREDMAAGHAGLAVHALDRLRRARLHPLPPGALHGGGRAGRRPSRPTFPSTPWGATTA